MIVIVEMVLRDEAAIVVVCVCCVVCIKLENELFPLFFLWGSLGTSDELLDSRRCVDRPTLCPPSVHPFTVVVVVAVVVLALHHGHSHNHKSLQPVYLDDLLPFSFFFDHEEDDVVSASVSLLFLRICVRACVHVGCRCGLLYASEAEE